MGKDAIPTLYDAKVSGYYSYEYQSGIGCGSNLYVNDIIEASGNTMYSAGQHPFPYYWLPEVNTGYFYIDNECYYLFSNKVTITGTPSGGKLELGTYEEKYPVPGSPVIVTLGASEFAANDPFGRTYNYSVTTNKYRKVTDLSDRKEYTVNDDGSYDTYTFSLDNMQFTIGASGSSGEWYRYIECSPSDSLLTVEFEGSSSGYFLCDTVDTSPLNTYRAHNKFLVISSSSITPSSLEVVNVTRYLPGVDDNVGIMAMVKDSNGIPVAGVTVSFIDDQVFSTTNVITNWDGTAYMIVSVPFSVNGSINITVTCGVLTETVYIPVGVR